MTGSLRFLYFLVALTFTSTLFAQKKKLNHSDKDLWNTIENRTISNDGNFVLYALKKGDRDQHLKIKSKNGTMIFEHERSENGKFTYDSKFAVFTIKAWQDSILEMKRRKVKKDEMPKDSVGIYDLNSKALHKIAHVKSYKLPEKWSGYMAYQLEEIKEKKKEKDSTEKTKDSTNKKKKKAPKVGKDNGYHLVLRNLVTQKEDTFKYVTNYTFAEKGQRLAYTTAGIDSVLVSNVHVLNLETSENTKVYSADKAKYYQLNFSESGKHLAFVVDADNTKAQIRPYELYAVKDNQKAAQKIIDSTNIPTDYLVSSDGRISFSKDDSKLYFGLRREPIIKDTSLVDEEIVNVEVWTYDEPRLYTVQELQANNDRKKSFQAVYHLNKNKLVQLASEEYPNLRLADEGNAKHALLSNPEPYLLESQWTGRRANDYVVVNTETGEKIEALKGTIAFMNLSPKGEYAYGYDPADSTWLTYSIKDNKRVDLTKGKVFYNELNDSPRHPGSYGIAGWTKDDASILIYDRYDIWQFNPDTGESSRLTKGRETKTRYRYLRLDDEERFLDPDAQWILSTFDENNKHSGFYFYDAKRKSGKQLIAGPYTYRNLEKAQQSDEVIYSRESFEEFPDIRLSTRDFSSETVISNANPQQSEYNWGTAELVSWTSLDGKELQGMLIKPEDFDPNKKYPMIVNFYEKSSDGLYRHRAPSWGRSTINYSYYTSNGYVIFNPDVHYRIGYPGESAYNCVIPGVTSLIEKGFIDKDNIGVQGHSWGGYQIAYLVTKTDIFKAAESGAPVPNMISAYGGIRWWTGLSRQFQYEHTQSRIGGTPWEYPLRYIENSPIFYLDKVNTPLLIMHNDADGHVPWYQGIEFFVSLRRLGKPSWFLNYNDEPHWPLKLQNRKDFNIRMAQFFDYYLKGAPKPVWMERGVPAIEKGINQGLELIKED